MKQHLFIIVLTLICFSSVGCSKRDTYEPIPPGLPRMIISGKVTNTSSEPLQGIYVAVFGVREPDEKDIITYNYAITDTAGQYTIIRYRGRELPTEVTVVATDSTGVYQEQVIFAPVTYDIGYQYGYEQYNAFVNADFVLSQQSSQP